MPTDESSGAARDGHVSRTAGLTDCICVPGVWRVHTSTIYGQDHPSCTACSWLLCHELFDHMGVFISGRCPVPLVCVSVSMAAPRCLCHRSVTARNQRAFEHLLSIFASKCTGFIGVEFSLFALPLSGLVIRGTLVSSKESESHASPSIFWKVPCGITVRHLLEGREDAPAKPPGPGKSCLGVFCPHRTVLGARILSQERALSPPTQSPQSSSFVQQADRRLRSPTSFVLSLRACPSVLEVGCSLSGRGTQGSVWARISV